MRLFQKMSAYPKEKKILPETKELVNNQNNSGGILKRGLLIVLLAGGMAAVFLLLRQRFSEVRSVQSFINSEVIVVRAPIAGQLELDLEKLKLGNALTKLTPIGKIESDVENSRVSDLRVRKLELDRSLQILQRQLEGINRQLENRNRLLIFFKTQQQTQKNLEVALAIENIKEQERLLEKAEIRATVETADAKRYTQLANQGAVDISTAERKVAQAKEAKANIEEMRAQINQAKLNLEAANIGVQLLNGARTFSFPEIRILELESEITDLEQQAENIKKQIDSNKFEFEGIQKELQIQESVPVLVPKNAAVWSIDSQSGENVEVNAPIAQLLNCNDVWVEAFINERDVERIFIGQPVEITLLGNKNRSWQGQVKTIRAGSGRVEIGEFNVQPPPEITRRQLPVRVATVRIAVDWKESLTPNNFCGAGLSVKTRFINK